MPSVRSISLVLSPAAEDAVDHRTGSRSRSAMISTMISRYADLMARSLPTLTRAEWSLVLDALNGTLTIDSWRPRYLLPEIEDAVRLNDAGEHHGCDGELLISRLSGMTDSELLAIVDQAETFWAAVARGEDPAVPGEV